MDFDFNPKEYSYRANARLPVDGTFWTKIKSVDGKNPIDEYGFYVPSSSLNRNWTNILKGDYGITEDIFYDPRVCSLPLEVSPEMLESATKKWQKNIVEDAESMGSSESKKSITAEDYLESERIKLMLKHKGKMFSNLSDWDQRVIRWRQGYGFLVDRKDMSGFLFPKPYGLGALKQEVVREYWFNISEDKTKSMQVGYYAGVILSLAEEPNSNRAIWGFRRDFATDWENKFPKEFIVAMSNLIRSLEGILK